MKQQERLVDGPSVFSVAAVQKSRPKRRDRSGSPTHIRGTMSAKDNPHKCASLSRHLHRRSERRLPPVGRCNSQSPSNCSPCLLRRLTRSNGSPRMKNIPYEHPKTAVLAPFLLQLSWIFLPAHFPRTIQSPVFQPKYITAPKNITAPRVWFAKQGRVKSRPPQAFKPKGLLERSGSVLACRFWVSELF